MPKFSKQMENNFRNISIENLLNTWGIRPEKRTEREGWYKAFNREERTPSLKVDYVKNVFFDHGAGRGGGVVEIVCLIRNCSANEAVEFLKGSTEFVYSPPFQNREISRIAEKNVITRVKKIEHPMLIEYLASREIDLELARIYCDEVEYKVNGKKYYSIGFRNERGGYEFRNAFSKASASPKAPTWIKTKKPCLAVFEGFFDFLSAITIDSNIRNQVDFLILNSLSFHQKIRKENLAKYQFIFFFLDNDEAGNNAFQFMSELHPNTDDRSSIYYEKKDLNEWLVEFKIKGLNLAIPPRNNNFSL